MEPRLRMMNVRCDDSRCQALATHELLNTRGVLVGQFCAAHGHEALAAARIAYETVQAAMPFYERDGFR